MKEIGAHEAKTHLAQLLDEVMEGETIYITRRGRRIAQVMPYREPELTLEQIWERLQGIQKSARKEGPSLREMIEEGRRY